MPDPEFPEKSLTVEAEAMLVKHMRDFVVSGIAQKYFAHLDSERRAQLHDIEKALSIKEAREVELPIAVKTGLDESGVRQVSIVKVYPDSGLVIDMSSVRVGAVNPNGDIQVTSTFFDNEQVDFTRDDLMLLDKMWEEQQALNFNP